MRPLSRCDQSIGTPLPAIFPATQVIIHELPMVRADAALARQVLVNLIDNALKYSALATMPRVEIGAAEDGAMYVRDNGIGFEMKNADALFNPFERVTGDPAYPGHRRGPGHGSSIARTPKRLDHRAIA